MKIYNELESLGFFEWLSETHNLKDTDMTPECLDELLLDDIHRTVCNSMAFRWFREKYNLDSFVKHLYKSTIKVGYYFSIDEYKGIEFQMDLDDYYKTYEEAELECLKKLIQIVKEK